jgi:hypothetical protein
MYSMYSLEDGRSCILTTTPLIIFPSCPLSHFFFSLSISFFLFLTFFFFLFLCLFFLLSAPLSVFIISPPFSSLNFSSHINSSSVVLQCCSSCISLYSYLLATLAADRRNPGPLKYYHDAYCRLFFIRKVDTRKMPHFGHNHYCCYHHKLATATLVITFTTSQQVRTTLAVTTTTGHLAATVVFTATTWSQRNVGPITAWSLPQLCPPRPGHQLLPPPLQTGNNVTVCHHHNPVTRSQLHYLSLPQPGHSYSYTYSNHHNLVTGTTVAPPQPAHNHIYYHHHKLNRVTLAGKTKLATAKLVLSAMTRS